MTNKIYLPLTTEIIKVGNFTGPGIPFYLFNLNITLFVSRETIQKLLLAFFPNSNLDLSKFEKDETNSQPKKQAPELLLLHLYFILGSHFFSLSSTYYLNELLQSYEGLVALVRQGQNVFFSYLFEVGPFMQWSLFPNQLLVYYPIFLRDFAEKNKIELKDTAFYPIFINTALAFLTPNVFPLDVQKNSFSRIGWTTIVNSIINNYNLSNRKKPFYMFFTALFRGFKKNFYINIPWIASFDAKHLVEFSYTLVRREKEETALVRDKGLPLRQKPLPGALAFLERKYERQKKDFPAELKNMSRKQQIFFTPVFILNNDAFEMLKKDPDLVETMDLLLKYGPDFNVKKK